MRGHHGDGVITETSARAKRFPREWPGATPPGGRRLGKARTPGSCPRRPVGSRRSPRSSVLDLDTVAIGPPAAGAPVGVVERGLAQGLLVAPFVVVQADITELDLPAGRVRGAIG